MFANYQDVPSIQNYKSVEQPGPPAQFFNHQNYHHQHQQPAAAYSSGQFGGSGGDFDYSLRLDASAIINENDDDDDDDDEDDIYTTKAPGCHDVLLGRGGATNNHPGNVKFRELVNQHKLRYLAASKVEKPNVAREVVHLWRNMSPPGHFLGRDEALGMDGEPKADALWFEVGDKKACQKASQCLRERTPDVMPYLKKLREEQDEMTKNGVTLVKQQLELQKKMEEPQPKSRSGAGNSRSPPSQPRQKMTAQPQMQQPPPQQPSPHRQQHQQLSPHRPNRLSPQPPLRREQISRVPQQSQRNRFSPVPPSRQGVMDNNYLEPTPLNTSDLSAASKIKKHVLEPAAFPHLSPLRNGDRHASCPSAIDNDNSHQYSGGVGGGTTGVPSLPFSNNERQKSCPTMPNYLDQQQQLLQHQQLALLISSNFSNPSAGMQQQANLPQVPYYGDHHMPGFRSNNNMNHHNDVDALSADLELEQVMLLQKQQQLEQRRLELERLKEQHMKLKLIELQQQQQFHGLERQNLNMQMHQMKQSSQYPLQSQQLPTMHDFQSNNNMVNNNNNFHMQQQQQQQIPSHQVQQQMQNSGGSMNHNNSYASMHNSHASMHNSGGSLSYDNNSGQRSPRPLSRSPLPPGSHSPHPPAPTRGRSGRKPIKRESSERMNSAGSTDVALLAMALAANKERSRSNTPKQSQQQQQDEQPRMPVPGLLRIRSKSPETAKRASRGSSRDSCDSNGGNKRSAAAAAYDDSKDTRNAAMGPPPARAADLQQQHNNEQRQNIITSLTAPNIEVTKEDEAMERYREQLERYLNDAQVNCGGGEAGIDNDDFDDDFSDDDFNEDDWEMDTLQEIQALGEDLADGNESPTRFARRNPSGRSLRSSSGRSAAGSGAYRTPSGRSAHRMHSGRSTNSGMSRMGIQRDISGLSQRSANRTISNGSIMSGVSMFSDFSGMGGGPSVMSNISFMSDISDLSHNIETLKLDNHQHQNAGAAVSSKNYGG